MASDNAESNQNVPQMFNLHTISEENAVQSENIWNIKGCSIDELYINNDPWNHYTPPLKTSNNDKVLFKKPVNLETPPEPKIALIRDIWDENHVKMPFSDKHIYEEYNGTEVIKKPKWELIKCVFQQPITTSAQLEAAILTYYRYDLHVQSFDRLHCFLNEVLQEEESQYFFTTLLPKIIQLALQLPHVIKAPIPLLQPLKKSSVSLSQLQIASLLANSFLCTFPHQDIERTPYRLINFDQLYDNSYLTNKSYQNNKLRCILNYFYRVCNKPPNGVITFYRKYLAADCFPEWHKLDTEIAQMKLQTNSAGKIEDDGVGLLQLDFADKYIGGYVTSTGIAQEESRFLICPELIVSRLFTPVMADTEALQIVGAERFNKYTGYGSRFKWTGNFDDQTPFDAYGRRKTSVLAIDAIEPPENVKQFQRNYIKRDLNKAYIGFYENNFENEHLSAVATGKWGCGCFAGDIHLKALIQIMACIATGRNMVYYSFYDNIATDSIYDMYQFLVKHKITVAQLWIYLCGYKSELVQNMKLFDFIKKIHGKILKNPELYNELLLENPEELNKEKCNCM